MEGAGTMTPSTKLTAVEKLIVKAIHLNDYWNKHTSWEHSYRLENIIRKLTATPKRKKRKETR